MTANEIRQLALEGCNVRVAPLAKAAGLDRSHLYALIADGHVETIRVGPKALRVPAHEARRLLGIKGD